MPPPTGIENYQYQQQVWKQEQMSSFKDFLRCYNNKNVVPTLEAMQKTFVFYQEEDIVMLKFGFTLPNLANICLHKATDANFYPFTDGDKNFLQKNREDVAGGPSIVFTRKTVVDETFLRKSLNLCKSIVGIDASQLFPTRCVNPCWPVSIRVGISIQKRVDSYLDKTRPAALKIWWCPTSNEQDQSVKMRASLQQADRRKMTASVLMGFVFIATLCLKPWVAFTTSAPVKSCVPLSLKKKFNVVARRESSMHWDDIINKKKVSKILKCGSANDGHCTKHPRLLSNISENTFLRDVHLQLGKF